MSIRFLRLDEVLALHVDQVARYGGKEGVRDLGLLESAVAVPEASFGGDFLHATLPEMAAAYLFHLAQNHAFVDGSKRVAAAAMFMFPVSQRSRARLQRANHCDSRSGSRAARRPRRRSRSSSRHASRASRRDRDQFAGGAGNGVIAGTSDVTLCSFGAAASFVGLQ